MGGIGVLVGRMASHCKKLFNSIGVGYLLQKWIHNRIISNRKIPVTFNIETGPRDPFQFVNPKSPSMEIWYVFHIHTNTEIAIKILHATTPRGMCKYLLPYGILFINIDWFNPGMDK